MFSVGSTQKYTPDFTCSGFLWGVFWRTSVFNVANYSGYETGAGGGEENVWNEVEESEALRGQTSFSKPDEFSFGVDTEGKLNVLYGCHYISSC